MNIREFEETDRSSLGVVYLQTRRQVFPWLVGSSLQLSDFDRDTRDEKLWVCEHEEAVIGFIAVQEANRFIHHLFVLPEFASRGYGSRLLETCMQYIGRPVSLKCVTANTIAVKFYQSKGWQIISRGVSSDGEYLLMESS